MSEPRAGRLHLTHTRDYVLEAFFWATRPTPTSYVADEPPRRPSRLRGAGATGSPPWIERTVHKPMEKPRAHLPDRWEGVRSSAAQRGSLVTPAMVQAREVLMGGRSPGWPYFTTFITIAGLACRLGFAWLEKTRNWLADVV